MQKNSENKILDAITNLAMVTGAGFDEVRQEFERVHGEIADTRSQIIRLETGILSDHEQRIVALEKKTAIK